MNRAYNFRKHGVGCKLATWLLVFVLLVSVVYINPAVDNSASYATDDTIVYLNIGANGFNEGNTSAAGDKAIKLSGPAPEHLAVAYNGSSAKLATGQYAGDIQLLGTTIYQAGGAFLSRPIYSETGFSGMFQIHLGGTSGTIADGWGFTVAKDTNAVGNPTGGGLGYGGIQNSYGFIYDTYNNNAGTAVDGLTLAKDKIPSIYTGRDGIILADYPPDYELQAGAIRFRVANGSFTQPELQAVKDNGATVPEVSNGSLYHAQNFNLYGWVDYHSQMISGETARISYYLSLTPVKPAAPIAVIVDDIEANLGNSYYLGFFAGGGGGNQQTNLRQLYVANDYLPDTLEFNPDGSGLADSLTPIEDYTAANAPSIMQVATESASDVAFTLGGSSDTNGLRKYQYSLNNGVTWVNYANGSTPVLDGSKKITAPIDSSDADGDGDASNLRVLARVIDNGGNISTITTQSLGSVIVPHAALTSPANGATNVFFADAQTLAIDFTNVMKISTVGTVTITAPSSSVALASGAITANDPRWNPEHTRLTLPLSGVEWGKTYEVKVNAFENIAGGVMVGEETFGYSVIAREAQPAGTIDYDAETITGLANTAKYKINGTEYTSSASGTIAILSGWLGTSVSIVKLGDAVASPPTYDSAVQSLAVPARPSAPTVSVSPGTITATQGDLFYASTATATSGTDLSSGANSVADGTHYVRQKADTSPYPSGSFRSEARQVEIAAQIYTLTLVAPTFSSIAFGDAQPIAQNLAIANIGNTESTINSVVSSSADFVIGGSGSSVTAGSNITTWNVRPASNLSVGVHTATVTVTYQTSKTVTANVSITVKEATPAATIDYVNERITGLISGQLYSVNGATAVNANSAGGSGVIALKSEWLGTSISVVKYNSTNSLLSDAANLPIPTRSGAPTAVVVPETFAGFSDGKITGVSATQEFSTDGGNNWRDVTSLEQTSGITGLAVGSAYQLRVKASNEGGGVFRSAYQALTITAGIPPTYTVGLSQTGTYTFTNKVYGYPTQTALTVGVTNTGNQPTGALTVAKSGANPGDFTVSTTSVSSIAVSGSNASAFTVKPNDGLDSGAHTATITVNGANGLTASFDVSFTVTPTQITGFVNPASFVAGRSDDVLPANPDAATVATSLLALPAYQNVTANFAGGTVSVPVTGWTNTTGTAYNPTTIGEYIFTATLGTIPNSNVGNTADLRPTVTVIINDILHGIQLGESGTYSIGTTEFGYIPSAYTHSVNITNIGVNVTESLQATLSGGASSDFTLSNGGVVGSIAIGESSTELKVIPKSGLVPGIYTDTLTVSDNGSTNTDLVSKTYDISFTVTDAEFTGFAAIADIDAGIAGSAIYTNAAAVIATLPPAVTANYAGGTVSVPVITWVDTDGYDPAVAGSYTFTATLGSIPANFLNGGGYTATVEVVVGVFVDKSQLIELIAAVEKVFGIDGLGIHKENYVTSQVDSFTAALASAKGLVTNSGATQVDVDTALSLLKSSYDALAHDHSVLKHSHSSGLTAFGQDVVVEIKGEFGDVTAFALNGTAYVLSPYVNSGTARTITEAGGGVIGTITKGSAVVTLPVAFADRLENGTHNIAVTFVDSYDAKDGVAQIVVNRVVSEPTPIPSTPKPDTPKPGTPKPDIPASDTSTPDTPTSDSSTPKTGDDFYLGLWLWVSGIVLIMLLAAAYALRRRQKV